MKSIIEAIIKTSHSRSDLCINIICEMEYTAVAEIGVYKGEFAEKILRGCKQVKTYIMIDPWRNLSDWNKPANVNDLLFREYYEEAIARTNFWSEKIRILKGKTTEVIDEVDDESCDLIYVDGDHTLKGISIDLISVWSKIKKDGVVLGDDFSPSIWQHGKKFDPSMVFPFAVHFAEAMNRKIYALPFYQFLICKGQKGFEFIDFTNGSYSRTDLREQLLNRNSYILRHELLRGYLAFSKLFKRGLP